MGSRNTPQSSHLHPGQFLSFTSVIIPTQIPNKLEPQVAMAAPVAPTADGRKKPGGLLPTAPTGDVAKEQQPSIRLAAESRTPSIAPLMVVSPSI